MTILKGSHCEKDVELENLNEKIICVIDYHIKEKMKELILLFLYVKHFSPKATKQGSTDNMNPTVNHQDYLRRRFSTTAIRFNLTLKYLNLLFTLSCSFLV